MKRTLIVSIFIAFVISCNRKSNNHLNNKVKHENQSSSSKIDTSKIKEVKKHDSSNEKIDTISDVLKQFIPKNYSVINISSGDANLDGLIDKILVLRKNTEETTSNFYEEKPDKRPLLLLLGQANNSYKLAFRNDNAVYCIDCGGAFGDPFTGTTIKKGYFSIEHGIVGGFHWENVTTFKYNKLMKGWDLYKDHYISYKFNDNNDENAEALVVDFDKMETEKDFGRITFDNFNIYNKDGN